MPIAMLSRPAARAGRSGGQCWTLPTVEVGVAVHHNGRRVTHRFRAHPHITLGVLRDVVDTDMGVLALDTIITTCLATDDAPFGDDSLSRWQALLDNDDVAVPVSTGPDLARHLVEAAANWRPFVEVCAFIGLTSGPTDTAAYIRGRLILAGLDDSSPIGPVLDVLMTTVPDTPAKELGEWRDKFDAAMKRSRMAAQAASLAANRPAPASADGPDRATWGLLPEHVAAQQRLVTAAGAI